MQPASKVVCNSMHSSACDHRVCCNIIHCPCLRILESRAHPAPCTQEHVSVHVCEQSQQIQEKGGRPATESACKCRSSSSQKQQLKAQIIYLIHLFFPSFQKKNIKQKYTNTGATTQQLPLALPQPTVPAYAPARAAV